MPRLTCRRPRGLPALSPAGMQWGFRLFTYPPQLPSKLLGSGMLLVCFLLKLQRPDSAWQVGAHSLSLSLPSLHLSIHLFLDRITELTLCVKVHKVLGL